MAKKTVTEIVGTIVHELTPLSSEERQRVIQATLMLLGEGPITPQSLADKHEHEIGALDHLPARVRAWLQQNGLLMKHLEQVFQIDKGIVEVIAAEIPGQNNRERVRNAYILAGVTQFLSSGNPKFDDKAGRALCESAGFYDSTNHSKYMKGGNEFIGSREKGWTLTAPGLKAGASLIGELSGRS